MAWLEITIPTGGQDVQELAQALTCAGFSDLVIEDRKRAKANGKDTELITADDKEGGDPHLDQLGGDKVTVLLRLWRDDKSGTIHGYECTKNAEIRKEWDLGIKLYPITWMNWDYVQDCYHGQAMITGLIPNQIFVNKLFAMSMISLMTLAYPKVLYADRISSNRDFLDGLENMCAEGKPILGECGGLMTLCSL